MFDISTDLSYLIENDLSPFSAFLYLKGDNDESIRESNLSTANEFTITISVTENEHTLSTTK